MTDQEQFYFSDKGLAKRWDMSFRTLQRWRWLGVGPPYTKIGGRVRYQLENIKKFEEENRCQCEGADQVACDEKLLTTKNKKYDSKSN